MNPIIKVKPLSHFCGQLPQYQTPLAAGCDVCASVETLIILKPGERTLVPTGLTVEIPEGYEIQVRPRSGLAIKHGIGVVNSPGTIDADYRGEIKIVLINWGTENFEIKRGDRLAQLVVAPVTQGTFVLSAGLNETLRGVDGFGSTGI